jgi:hypothetical protein
MVPTWNFQMWNDYTGRRKSEFHSQRGDVFKGFLVPVRMARSVWKVEMEKGKGGKKPNRRQTLGETTVNAVTRQRTPP